MPPEIAPPSIQSRLSLEPLLSFWRAEMVPKCTHMAAMFEVFESQLKQENGDGLCDEAFLEKNQELLMPLMSVAFPAASWETDIAAALTPFTLYPFYHTPTFGRLFMKADGSVKGYLEADNRDDAYNRQLLRTYWLILGKVHGIGQDRVTPMIYVSPDLKTGLDRYYRILPDWRFVNITTSGPPKTLTAEERDRIVDHISDVDVLEEIIPLNTYHIEGFVIIRAVDVTESEVVLALERTMIDQQTIFSREGFSRLQSQLRTLFGRPDLRAGMGALRDDRILVINDGSQSAADCIFTNSSHIPLNELENSVWMHTVNKARPMIVKDLAAVPTPCMVEEEAVRAGVRSMIIAPLFFKGDIIGTFQIMMPRPNELGPMDKRMVKQIAPLFSVALKRGLDDMNAEVQAIIKEKCTVVHPSVEWRFQKAALSHMDRLRAGLPSEMEPIVFKKVIPLFGQTDIRGSSRARSQAIQSDLKQQLDLARTVLNRAGEVRSWPIINALQYKLEKQSDHLLKGLIPEAETSIIDFLQTEVEPTFEELAGLDPNVAGAIETYRHTLDPDLGFIYRKRKAFEQSVSLLNKQLSGYLDREERVAQKDFPHYFEKHQTDGIDYVIYVGQSMMENGQFTRFHLKNMLLWQLMVACGMAWHTIEVKPELAVALDSCHLILYHNTPLSIRFRYDEKRFDVDGAYDVRHEIIKSRLDKAYIKGGGERLTQPGRIAIVYAHSQEGSQMREHIEFLQSKGHLNNDLEAVDVEDLSGIGGLKALRVGVNLQAPALARRIEKLAG